MNMHTQATRAFSLSPTLNVELCFAPEKLKKKKINHASSSVVEMSDTSKFSLFIYAF